jgi:hypothetical protein
VKHQPYGSFHLRKGLDRSQSCHTTYCGREELGAVSFSAFIDRAANYF